MKIKKFTFPSFDDWVKSENYEYSTQIGAYHLAIGTLSWNKNRSHIVMAVSTSSNPLNIYSSKLYEIHLNIYKETSKEKIKKWYNESINAINAWWIFHIVNEYID